jgi:hypothetical protein
MLIRALRSDTLRGMCMEISCPTCERPTWAGCGAHVEQVLGHIPPSDRCQCDSADSSPSTFR